MTLLLRSFAVGPIAPILLLVVLMGAASLPLPVSAAGDDIRVLSNQKEVRFPGEVVFNLEVEGEADIVEVRLHLRIPPSLVWTYTYPDLTPSNRVKTSFDLDVSGDRYLPPGTELEYYYTVRDAQGNIMETGPETLVYVDGRYQWQTAKAGPLTIFWHDLSEKQVNKVARQVEKSLNKIGEILELDLDVPVKGVIYNSRSEDLEALPYQSDTITREQVFQGFAFPDRGIFVGVGLNSDLVIHETAHLLLKEATASPRARVPAWVNEGFASSVEPGGQGYRERFPRGATPELMPLRHMYTIPGKPDAIRYFYRKSESVVGYLLETHGEAEFRRFLGHLNEGEDQDTALISAYGFGLDELDQRWSASVGQNGTSGDQGGDSAIFASLNTMLIAVLALLVTVILVVNFVARRLVRRDQESDTSDRLTEEEWWSRP